MNQIQDATALLPTITFAGDRTNRYPVNPNSENVELSLGLSLNGKFGSEPQRSMPKNNNNKLFRASSVSNFVNFPVDVGLSLNMNMNTPLTRSCSLPPEMEMEEWRKRKELQSLRRSEAKRRRVEKLKNGMKQFLPSPSPAILKSPATPVRLPSQGSVGSQESGGSSGVSDLDSKPFAGTNKVASKTNEGSELGKLKSNPTIKLDQHYAYNETMPCVSTKGDGPNGRRIQGFLYRYGKDEEVRIVCVCHGSFLTPAEFVKHGGGGDVEHPLRHILVTSLFR